MGGPGSGRHGGGRGGQVRKSGRDVNSKATPGYGGRKINYGSKNFTPTQRNSPSGGKLPKGGRGR